MSALKLISPTSLITTTAAIFFAAATLTQATPTFWTGSIVSFSHAPGGPPDQWTSSHTGSDSIYNVWITRGARQALYNSEAETGWNDTFSPSNTMWVVAPTDVPLTSANTLTYDIFANVVGRPGGPSPGGSVNTTFYVHILSDDIYLQLTLTEWGNDDGGSFAYNRSTPATVTPPTPTVSLTNPPAGSVFAAPAALKLKAAASVSSGVVTNVQFFANTTTSLGSITTAPFNLTSSPLAAGSYSLSAVATAAGVSATSSVVNVSVVNPVTVHLSSVQIAAGKFDFSANVSTGLSYVVQSSSNLVNWVSLSTNQPTATPVSFSNLFSPQRASYYRIGLLPNP